VVPDHRRTAALAGFGHDEIEADRQAGEGRSILREPAERGLMNPRSLPMVDRLLGEAEVAPPSPADLHDHELPGRAGIHRHDVQLCPPDAKLPPQDDPTARLETRDDGTFRSIAQSLDRGPHVGIVPDASLPRLIVDLRPDHLEVTSEFEDVVDV
jgi:hypothetical protein